MQKQNFTNNTWSRKLSIFLQIQASYIHDKYSPLLPPPPLSKFGGRHFFFSYSIFYLGQVRASYLTQLIKAAEDKIWGRENFLAKFRYSAYIWTWGNENPSFSSKVDCSLYWFKTFQIIILSIFTVIKYYTHHYTIFFTYACFTTNSCCLCIYTNQYWIYYMWWYIHIQKVIDNKHRNKLLF